MPISRKLFAGGLAGAALLLSAGAALADPAEATGAVNVRSGPGVNYSIVDQLYPGETVDVGQCEGGWCFVDHSGPDGWVSANYLSPLGGYAPPPPVYYEPEPEYVPAPVFINPPGFYHRYFRHFPGRPFPPGSAPPPVQHRHFPPPGFPHNGVPHNGVPPQFHFHPGGPVPGGVHPPRAPHPGGGNICATNPSAPICSGGSGPHRHH